MFFWGQFCDVTSGDDPHEYLAKFSCKLNMKIFQKYILQYFGYVLESCIEMWWFFLNFGRIIVNNV